MRVVAPVGRSGLVTVGRRATRPDCRDMADNRQNQFQFRIVRSKAVSNALSRVVAGLLLVAASTGANAGTTSATFNPPLVRSVSPDACLTAGKDCGKPAADAFCKAAGFQDSRKHVVLSGPISTAPTGVTPNTIFLGDGRTCGRTCKPLVLVACYSSSPTFSATSSSDWGTVTGP